MQTAQWTGWAEFRYFLCYFKIIASRALVFRPLVKGNKPLGTRLGIRETLGPQVGFSLFVSCSKNDFSVSVQVSCHFSFQGRFPSLLVNNMQTNEFQERKQKYCVLWPKCLLRRRRCEKFYIYWNCIRVPCSLSVLLQTHFDHCINNTTPVKRRETETFMMFSSRAFS